MTINKHILTSLNIYEFQCPDLSSIDDLLTEVKTSQHHITKSGNKSIQDSLVIYADENSVPFYHEKLYDWIQACIDEVSTEYFTNLKFSICDTWIHKASFGTSSLDVHVHTQSVFSGLLYLTDHVTAKKGKTVFYFKDPVTKKYDTFHPMGTITRSFTSKPEKGKLLIWPSFIPHNVEPIDDLHQTRYTLSFNTWPDGTISDYPTKGLKTTVETARDRWLKSKANSG